MHTHQVFLNLGNAVYAFSFGKLNNDSFWSLTWQVAVLAVLVPVAVLNVGRVYFDIQFFKQFESCVFHL